MTGFGRAQRVGDAYALRVELRSVNNRSLKIVCRLPDAFVGREMEIERILREQVTRGSVYVTVDFESLSGASDYSVDVGAVKAYYRELLRLKQELGDAEPVRIESLLLLPGSLAKSKTAAHISDEVWEETAGVLREAMAGFVAMRAQEGAFLWKTLLEHNAHISAYLDDIRGHLPAAIRDFRARLTERLDALLAGRSAAIEPAVVDREVAVLADRSDISEELNRLRSHVEHLAQAPNEGLPCGRKVEFIIQEMFREANTMASKASDAHLVRDVLELKNEIDKLREQVQNLE